MKISKPTLTVFTPSYNRARLLARGYESLLRQTSHDFCWIIIDDGSNDNTRELARSWFDINSIEEVDGHIIGVSKDASWLKMHYYYKENGGLHTGYNKAIELMDTELCVCIDSDDYMPDDAVEIIVKKWRNYNNGNIAGLVGLDCRIDGDIIGNGFPEGKITHYISLKEDKHFNCDNKIVMRVDLLKKVAPQPSFPNERNFNPIWMVLKIDEIAPFVLINNNLCFVDYQDGGMSNNLINQYFNSPNSFLELRKLYVKLKYASTLFHLRNHIHLISQCLIAEKPVFKESPNKFISFLFCPLGYTIYRFMVRQHNKFNSK